MPYRTHVGSPAVNLCFQMGAEAILSGRQNQLLAGVALQWEREGQEHRVAFEPILGGKLVIPAQIQSHRAPAGLELVADLRANARPRDSMLQHASPRDGSEQDCNP